MYKWNRVSFFLAVNEAVRLTKGRRPKKEVFQLNKGQVYLDLVVKIKQNHVSPSLKLSSVVKHYNPFLEFLYFICRPAVSVCVCLSKEEH